MSSSKHTTVLYLGATGYIGAAALDRILNTDKDSNLRVTVMVRDKAKAAAFATVDPRLTPLNSSLGDLELLETQASKHDIVVNTADADDLPATEAILRGMAKRTKETGVKSILIHTSGTGMLSDIDDGSVVGEKIYTDYKADDTQSPPWLPVSALPPTQLHRDVDMTIERAAEAGDVRAYIVAPSTIYGLSKNRFVEAGLANPQSQQMPQVIRVSIARGKVSRVGQGKNIWNNVHTDDVSDLFAVVFTHAQKDNRTSTETQYFIGENGEYSLHDASAAIGKVLAARKLVSSPEPVTLTKDELDKYYGGSTYPGSNSRGRGVRGRKLGWKPKFTEKDFFASFEDDVAYTLQSKRARGPDGEFVFPAGWPLLKNGSWVMP